jgi:hypothetical protein
MKLHNWKDIRDRRLGALGFDLEIASVAGNKRIVIRREHAHR